MHVWHVHECVWHVALCEANSKANLAVEASSSGHANEHTVQDPVHTPAPARERRRPAGQRCLRCCTARPRMRVEQCCG